MMVRFLALLLLLFCWLPVRAEPVAVPPLSTRVTDLTATLTVATKEAIEAKLADLEQRKGSQLAVLILPSTGGETIEQFGIRVAEAWKLGRKGVDDGILLLVAKDDRTLRIEVGYGLEGAIPDVVGKRVIEEIIVPRFKAGDFDGGVLAGVDSLIKLVDGEPLPEPVARPDSLPGSSIEDVLPVVMLFVFVGGGILRAIFGPLLGATLAGGVAFVGAWLLAGTFLVGLVVAVVVFFLTLVGVSGGGGGGRGGFGSGRGGGFSGGGGSFGGGGASGRW
ncbi:MAG: YgcG family protein [Thiobacillus sp.]|nr:YgcG family protein [Thiobacillus sp.]